MSQSDTASVKYSDLVNVSSFGKKREEFNPERGAVAHYCRDCRRIVEATQPNPNKQKFICSTCGGANVSTGTEEGLKGFYERPKF
jgi:Zn finger protein HypA/HybF involved in hydrogenase expression